MLVTRPELATPRRLGEMLVHLLEPRCGVWRIALRSSLRQSHRLSRVPLLLGQTHCLRAMSMRRHLHRRSHKPHLSTTKRLLLHSEGIVRLCSTHHAGSQQLQPEKKEGKKNLKLDIIRVDSKYI